jgi:hypothetical protein
MVFIFVLIGLCTILLLLLLTLRKYVPIDPRAIQMHYYPCAKAYVNVHSSSMEEPHAIICCPPNSSDTNSSSNNSKYWSWIMGSYEVALCAGKVRIDLIVYMV